MRSCKIWPGLVILGLMQALSSAQPGERGFGGAGGFGGQGGLVAPPAVAAETPAPKIESQLIPGEKFENMPLDEVLNFIHDKLPEFNSVVVRTPGAREDYPVIPRMSVKNVTIGQFLEFLKASFPGVDIQRIDGPAGPLYVVKVISGPMDQANFGGFPGAFGGGGLPAGMAPGPAPFAQPQNVVQVYKLTDIVASLIAGKEGGQRDLTRASLTDILSLIQSALEESGEKEAVVLKVHEQTQTLLFKGSQFKQAVLEQVLNTLRPVQDPIQTQQVNELRDKVRVLDAQREIDEIRRNEALKAREQELAEMRARLQDIQKVNADLARQNTQLNDQLEQAQKQAK